MKKIKLFCFPYAGGSAMIYLKLKKYLDDSIELCPVELAGRGRRYGTPLYGSIDEAVTDVFSIIKDELHNYDYAFMGYSMGTLIAYELINKIKEEGIKGPKHAFLCAKEPPHIKLKEENLHKLPNDKFIREIIKLGGTPTEIVEEKELLDFFVPILKADYRIVELYNHGLTTSNLDCDITILGGKDDDITVSDMNAWNECTSKKFQLHMFEGGHFFINDNIKSIAMIINDALVN